MDVPLSVHRRVVDGEQFLDVWRDGKRERVPAPFRPYCYHRDRTTVGDAEHVEEVTVRPLSTLQEETWLRAEYATVHGVSQASRRETPRSMADNHVAYTERVLLDDPSYYRRWPQTEPLRILTLDVEQLTRGEGFPGPDQPLVSIAWRQEVLDEDPGTTTCLLTDPDTLAADPADADQSILQGFLRAFREFDPDLVVGYNLTGYDLPLLGERLQRTDLPTTPLTRTNRRPTLDEGNVHLEGRLVVDVYDQVRRDQTLYGIKDRGLDTVARWMGFDVVEADVTNTANLAGTPELQRYNENDVDITRDLLHVYLRNHLELADLYHAPLNLVLRATSSFHTRVLQGRILHRLGIVSDGRNDERYPDLYADGGQGFVGGLVDIYQRGLFRPVWHVDFSSMYPSVLVSLGCGADNTRHLGTEPRGDFRVDATGDTTLLSVPDTHRDVNHRVEIQGRSPLSRELGELLTRRLQLKAHARSTQDPDERARLHARQNALKVVLNSIYGVMASRHARTGSLPVAIAVVGVARRLIREVESYLGDACIETDTDGVYSADPVDPQEVNAHVRDFAQRELGAEGPLRLDVDRYAAGYFHEAKNYLLLHDDDRIEKHGVAFKGSSHCGVFDRTLDEVSRALLSGEEDVVEVARACRNLDRYDPQDFIMRIRLGKDPGDYAQPNALGAQVARAARRHTDTTPTKGTRLEYVKTRTGYDIVRPASLRRLDHGYYREMVDTLLDRLRIPWRPTQQTELGRWL